MYAKQITTLVHFINVICLLSSFSDGDIILDMNEDNLIKRIGRLINPIRKDIKTIKETQDSHTETLGGHTTSLLEIETTLKAYGDMYKINDDNTKLHTA